VIRIRYKDISAGTHDCTGLHGRADSAARGVTVYLVPGLTAGERRAVFRRLRQEADRGFGPPLPQSGLAVARCLDRVGTAARVAAAVVRLHPAVTLLPGVCVAAGMAFFVVAAAGGQSLPDGPAPGLAGTTSAGPASARAASAASISALPVSAAPAPGWITVGGRAGGPVVPAQLAPMTEVAGVALFTVDAVGGTSAP
jgi:hypothetical protein